MQVQPFIGADVAKATVDVAAHDGSFAPTTITNDRTSIRRWLKTLPAGARLAVEATGTFHRPLVELAHALGFEVFVLNPAQVSHYARSIGRRAKTDRLDAELIARYLAREHAELHRWTPPTALQQEIDDLVRQRAQIVKHRTALRQSGAQRAALKQPMRALDRALGTAIAAVDKALQAAAAKEEALKRQLVRLRAIPGVGALVSIALANRLNAIPLRSADAAVAYMGLDPRTRESGTYRGLKKLSKRGDAELRRLLYVAAMSTARNPLVAPLMAAYRQRGLPATAAYNVLARRLVRTVWSMLRYDKDFDLNRFVSA